MIVSDVILDVKPAEDALMSIVLSVVIGAWLSRGYVGYYLLFIIFEQSFHFLTAFFYILG